MQVIIAAKIQNKQKTKKKKHKKKENKKHRALTFIISLVTYIPVGYFLS